MIYLRKLIVIACLLFCQISKGQMRQVYLDTATNTISRINFCSPSTGYVTFNNFLGLTIDSGRTFTKKFITSANINFNGYAANPASSFYSKGVWAFSADTVIVYGHWTGGGPTILSSTDGGNSYKMVMYYSASGTFGFADMIFPGNGSTGYAVQQSLVFKTTDKGGTWIYSHFGSGINYTHIGAVDTSNVIVYSALTNNKLTKTSNGGLSWQILTLPVLTGGMLTSASFIDQDKGWINMIDAANKLYLFGTDNGGSSWTMKNDPLYMPPRMRRMKFVNDSTGYGTYFAYTVYQTKNSGKTWDPLPRDNNYSGSLNNDMYILGNYIWTGGGKALEFSSDTVHWAIPQAQFKTDTNNIFQTGVVNLVNLSNAGNTYEWYLNNTLISTSYNASYVHNAFVNPDTITLIVSNPVSSDTLTRYQYVYSPVNIYYFSPVTGAPGDTVYIFGNNFNNATQVTFGGVTSPSIVVISNSQIKAVVPNYGMSGFVSVYTPLGLGTKWGFTFTAAPAVNLPVSLSKSVLCRSEPVIITIQQTEPDVNYALIDSLQFSYGSLTSTGGSLSFPTTPISRSGNYRIKATRISNGLTNTFTQPTFIEVEQTTSAFAPLTWNLAVNENTHYYQHSRDAQLFEWIFGSDANVSGSLEPNPQNISYSSTGQKTVTLISSSTHGCKDTATAPTVFVYNKPVPGDSCFVHKLDAQPAGGQVLRNYSRSSGNGFIITGNTIGEGSLISRYGNSLSLPENTAYVAKYSTDGALKWVNYIKGSYRNFYESATDNEGNVYVTGSCRVHDFMIFSNGDSLKLAATPTDVVSYLQKLNGFVVKLDSMGRYIWHTIIDDPSPEFQGYPVQGGIPLHLKLQDNRILVAGDFYANLAYCRNGVKQVLFSLPNSTSPQDLQNNFIINIDTSGQLRWSTYYENSSVNSHYQVSDITLDETGNAYILGIYESNVAIRDAAGTTFTLSAPGYGYNTYMVKLDSTGLHQWRVFCNDFASKSLFVDASGSIYITGTRGNFQVTNSDNSVINYNLNGFQILKFSNSGINTWAVGTINASPFPYATGFPIAIKENMIYTAGMIYNNGQTSTTFGFKSSDSSVLHQQISYAEFIVVQYDTLGILHRVAKSGVNPGGHIVPFNISIDDKDHLLLGGYTDLQNGGSSPFAFFGMSVPCPFSGSGFFSKLSLDYCLALPPPAVNAGSDTAKCQADSIQIGKPAIPGTEYFWTSNPQGFTSTEANPSVSPSATTSFRLSVIDATGIVARDSTTVSIIPAAIANAGSDISICAGDAGVLLGSPAVMGYQYSWQPSTGLNSASLAQPTASPLATTTYNLQAITPFGCDTAFDTVVVVVIPLPAAPVVSVSGNIFTSSAASGNQWYRDFILIPGAVNQTFTAVTSGTYSVKATENNCISGFSNAVNYIATSIQNISLETQLYVGPNPMHNNIIVNYKGPITLMEVSVIDATGKQVVPPNQFSTTKLIEMKGFSSGLYVLRIRNLRNGEQVNRLILKQ